MLQPLGFCDLASAFARLPALAFSALEASLHPRAWPHSAVCGQYERTKCDSHLSENWKSTFLRFG